MESNNAFFIIAARQWMDQEDGNALLLTSLEYLDVVTLIQRKPVSKQWDQLCTQTIDNKCQGEKKKLFQSNEELRDAVKKYTPTNNDNNRPCNPKDAESIASTYGYPIDKWDVSNIQDFSLVFQYKYKFNEPIRSWDVSNATNMEDMFSCANSFNQDISSWDLSNVTNMNGLFYNAISFNQDISSWDVSKVTDMGYMFYGAANFNQDLSTWDVSNVKSMRRMFYHATSFNQDLSSWDVSSITDIYYFSGMFHDCLYNAERLPWFTATMRRRW